MPAPALSPAPAPAPREISLSAELKGILENPIDPRVDRILQGIYADKAAAEQALNPPQIVAFPRDKTAERHVVQDENGFWRIVPGPAPAHPISLLDAL